MHELDVDNRKAILKVIRDGDLPQRAVQIAEAKGIDADKKTVSNLLYRMKQEELIISDERMCYSITAKGRAYLGGKINIEATHRPGRRPYTRRTAPHNGAGNGVEDILLKAERDAQDALDNYLATVGDPNIITPLRASRDSARQAREAWRTKT